MNCHCSWSQPPFLSWHSLTSLQVVRPQPRISIRIHGATSKLMMFNRTNLASIGFGKFMMDWEAPSRTRNSTWYITTLLNTCSCSVSFQQFWKINRYFSPVFTFPYTTPFDAPHDYIWKNICFIFTAGAARKICN